MTFDAKRGVDSCPSPPPPGGAAFLAGARACPFGFLGVLFGVLFTPVLRFACRQQRRGMPNAWVASRTERKEGGWERERDMNVAMRTAWERDAQEEELKARGQDDGRGSGTRYAV